MTLGEGMCEFEWMNANWKPSLRERRALAAYVKLLRASESVHSEAVRPLSEHDLSPSQFAVLEALYNLGPLCLGDLAKKILKTSGNLTMVVDNLEKRGLAVRGKSSTDRRFVTVQITEAGERVTAKIFPGHAAKITELMSRLTAREQATLAELCRKLGKG